MKIEKTVNLPASQEVVWRAMEDMEDVILCMPGVSDIQKLSDDVWNFVMKQKIGIVSVVFDVEMKLTEFTKPTLLKTQTEAKARMGLGMAFQNQVLGLEPVSADCTLARYEADVALSGKMGLFGQRVLGGKVEEIANKFLGAFVARLQAVSA